MYGISAVYSTMFDSSYFKKLAKKPLFVPLYLVFANGMLELVYIPKVFFFKVLGSSLSCFKLSRAYVF